MVSEIISVVPTYTKDDINTKILTLGVEFFGEKYDEE
jgi:hypothetical protein